MVDNTSIEGLLDSDFDSDFDVNFDDLDDFSAFGDSSAQIDEIEETNEDAGKSSFKASSLMDSGEFMGDMELDEIDLDSIDFDIGTNSREEDEDNYSDGAVIDASELEDDEETTLDEDDEGNYSDGAVIDASELEDDDEPALDDRRDSDFISDSGNIVVQDTSEDKGNGFELIYVDIEKIAITRRVRKMESVDALVQSIKSTGLLEPIVVAPTATKDLYVLLSGYRRIQACARAGKTRIPCVVNNRVNTPEIPILEAMYNHSKPYSIKEQVDYIDYLEKEKGIMNPSLIEYLIQMNSGDYTKLKDILNDNDDDIVSKLYEGVYTIATAFKKLEQRRRKETQEEKENKKAAQVYNDEEESGVDQISGSGEEVDGEALTDEQLNSLGLNADNLDDDTDNVSLGEMIEEDKNIKGFEDHKQKVGEREYIDPVIKKTVMARDNSTCQCCKRGGQQYVDVLDFHHIVPVYLGGKDRPENGIMLCVACHRLVHLYSTGDLHIDKALLLSDYSELNDEQKSRYENEQIFEDEKKRFKRVIKLGSEIRKHIAASGMNKKQYKKEHSNDGIGRRKPGVKASQEKA